MDILYTVEEKYLQAIEELSYGELPKALHLFHEVIQSDSGYARAHYQLGCFYHHHFKDYQAAGYYYKTCIELEPTFPDVYEHYLKLAVTLKLHKLVEQVADKALLVPGVCRSTIYVELGLYAEAEQNFTKAAAHYKQAVLLALDQNDRTLFKDHLTRISDKQKLDERLCYAYTG